MTLIASKIIGPEKVVVEVKEGILTVSQEGMVIEIYLTASMLRALLDLLMVEKANRSGLAGGERCPKE